MDRPACRRPEERRDEEAFARGHLAAGILQLYRLALPFARLRGKFAMDVVVLADPCSDGAKLRFSFRPGGPALGRDTGLIPLDADRANHSVD